MSKSAEYPYRTFARKETHPARIGAIARLHGMDAPPISQAAVLELGCGDGSNCIPLAERNPQSRFVGVDRAADLVCKGRGDIEQLGLTNIELVCADIESYSPESGAFDYVICHGVYSWVASNVQARILEIGKRALAPHGVLFVSYNTLPGWRQRGAVRDILQIGSRMSSDLSDGARYDAGMKLLSAVAREGAQVPAYVREAAERLADSEPSYVIQEFLEEFNTPLLFRDFMHQAQAHGLQFLSEARVVMMSSEDLSAEMKSLLDSLGEDITMREQVLDLVRNRTFRETLLCRDSITLNRGLSARIFKELVFVANYLPTCDSQSLSGTRLKERYSGKELIAPPGECEQVLRLLAQKGSAGAGFLELSGYATADLALSEHELMRVLVTLWRTGFIDALTSKQCGERDLLEVSKVAALQAHRGEKTTSALHESFKLSEYERRILELLQSPMSRQALEDALVNSMDLESAQVAMQSLSEKGFFL